MTATAAERSEVDVGRRKAEQPEPEPVKYTTLVRMADDVGELARVLAPMKGVSMGELMSDILRPVLLKLTEEELRRRLGKK